LVTSRLTCADAMPTLPELEAFASIAPERRERDRG